MDKIKLESSNIADENFEKLASLFPNVVTETIVNDRVERAIDIEKLKQEINAHILSENEECYNFTWPDKRKSVVLANTPTRNTLRACKAESKDFDNTENLYIEGDNLEVLKLLRNTYMGQIKMIYIDPPYNTGKDFVYQDNFYINKEEYKEMSGQFDKEGNRLFENTEANGRFHTDWLNMMYPRLKMARDLLTDDGAIFISIDENEVSNLRKICDEIFGGGNYIQTITIQMSELKGAKLAHVNKKFPKVKEFLLIFSKKKDLFNLNPLKIKKSDAELINYSKYYNKQIININDECSDWKCIENNCLYNDKIQNAESFIYLVAPDNNININIPDKTFKKIMNSNGEYIHYYNDGGKIKKVLFLSETQYTYISDIWLHSSTININKETYGIPTYSNGQKPLELIYTILESFITDNCIILDFFSGSNTTADALIRYNLKNNYNNKFISIQAPFKIETTKNMTDSVKKSTDKLIEFLDAHGKPHTICEIGKERIRRAGEKIKKDYPNANVDTGFRVFKLDSSNMEDVYYEAEKISQQDISKTISYIKADRSEEDLLFQIILSCGIPLKCKIEIKKVNNRDVYFVDDTYLIVCFEKDIDDNTIEELAKRKPHFMVFNQNVQDSTLANIKQIFKLISSTTIMNSI